MQSWNAICYVLFKKTYLTKDLFCLKIRGLIGSLKWTDTYNIFQITDRNAFKDDRNWTQGNLYLLARSPFRFAEYLAAWREARRLRAKGRATGERPTSRSRLPEARGLRGDHVFAPGSSRFTATLIDSWHARTARLAYQMASVRRWNYSEGPSCGCPMENIKRSLQIWKSEKIKSEGWVYI